MAIGDPINSAGIDKAGASLTIPASVRGEWTVINDDLTTAQATGDRLAPFLVDDEGFHWVRVPDGATRALWCARTAVAAGMSSTATVRIIGADIAPTTNGGYVTGDTVHFTRIDNVSPSAGGITIAQATTTTGFLDGTYVYGAVTSLTATDLLGCAYVGMLVESAASQSGSGAVAGMVRFLN